LLELAGLGLENLDKLATDDLALLLGIADALQVAHELRRGVDMHHPDAEIAGKGVHHLGGFVEAQQAVIDENAGQLVTDRAVNQRCRDRRIDAARKTENHFFSADLRTNLVDCLGDVIGHVPVVSTTADVAHEAADDFPALERVRDFGVKLHGVESAILVGHRRNGRRFVAADDPEARRQFGDLVAMAHPDVEQAVTLGIAAILDALEQCAVATRAHFGIAEFTSVRAFDLAAQLRLK
jgi:hypothetical protein